MQEVTTFAEALLQQVYRNTLAEADLLYGGFGKKRKTPHIPSLQFLLAYGVDRQDERALLHVRHTLNQMLRGGIFDQLGGGIFEYTEDPQWLWANGRKTLSTNALFIQLLAQYLIASGRRKYRRTLYQTLSFVEKEMTNSNGWFITSIGKNESWRYYAWRKEEVVAALGEGAALFCDFFDLSDEGNRQGINVLHQPHDRFVYADTLKMDRDAFYSVMKQGRDQLLEIRRQRPALPDDDTVVVSENALMVSAYAQTYTATGEAVFLKKAEEHLERLLLIKQPFTATDTIGLIRALLDVYAVSPTRRWIDEAVKQLQLLVQGDAPPTALLASHIGNQMAISRLTQDAGLWKQAMDAFTQHSIPNVTWGKTALEMRQYGSI